MGLKCKIREIDGKRVPMKGNEMDPVYKTLLEYYKNDEMALQSWAKVNSLDLADLQVFEGEEPTSDLALFIDQSTGNQELEVTEKEQFEILNLAVTRGFSELPLFLDFLNKTLKPFGRFNFSPDNLLESGLFTITDLETLTVDKVVDILNKTEALVGRGIGNELTAETPTNVSDTSRKNVVRGTRKLTQEEMVEEVLQVAAQDFLSLEEAIEQTGYEEIRSKVNSEKFEELTLIQEVDPTKDTLDLNFLQSRKVLENTLLSDIDTTDLESDIDFINSIDSDVWDSKKEAVYKITKEIELSLAKNGIDVVGLADSELTKVELSLFLRTVQNMIASPNDVTITAFYEQLNIIGDNSIQGSVKGSAKLVKVFGNDPNLDLVEVNSNMSLTELYNKHGLVKFKDNLFFKVQKESKDILYEKMYVKYTQGQEIDEVSQKADILKGLTDLVNTYKSSVDESIREEYTLYKLLSGKATTEELRTQDTSYLRDVTPDPEYLKTEFVSDFNKYKLEEKFKNSEIYNKVLKKIKITDAGIIVENSVTSLQGIEYKQELEDHIRLHRGNFGKHLISKSAPNVLDRDLYFLNNKNKIREVQTQHKTSGEYLVTKENPNLYVRVAGTIYRKVVSKNGDDLYAKVRGNFKDNLFYDNDTNYETNIQEAFEILDRLKLISSDYQKPDINKNDKLDDTKAKLDSGLVMYKEVDQDINEKIENCG
jgi:hypothetical protein